MKRCMFAMLVAILAFAASGRAAEGGLVFPPAGEGVVKFVLPLPHQDDESLFKLELIVGKTVRIDPQNDYFFGGKIEAQRLKGGIGRYYRVTSLGAITGSFMDVEPGTPQVNRFVPLGGDPFFIRYDSRIPVVIYVPEGAEVRYRLWSAGPALPMSEKG